ncbi:hypothetical protein CFIO01_07839 [Colletotrichum fioriniae PJ7]|uniref:Uncharacterized protein n=1 Tax=Colletotrichum fioriniae PJ7 TaxID=1445577 RepID=A0A010R904_9PEZI|nr:hypothetical protein CFIO01_07839 [Colletotrichum fioriniae PJ7]
MSAASPASTAQPFSLIVAARFVSTVWAGQRRVTGSFNLVFCVWRVERGISELATKFRQLQILENMFSVEFHRKARERALPKSGYQSPTGFPQHDMSLTGGYCEGSLEEGKEAHPSDSPLDNEGG